MRYSFRTLINTTIPPLTDIALATIFSWLTLHYHILRRYFALRKMYLNSWFALIALDTNKASRSNGISGRVLKGTSHSIAHCSTCQLKLGRYHKNGKFLHCPQFPNLKLILMTLACNYRPISLLLVVSKLLERHMYSLVIRHWAGYW